MQYKDVADKKENVCGLAADSDACEGRGIVIRPGTDRPEDIEAAILIENRCFAHPWSDSDVAESVKNDGILFFFAEIDGETAGCVSAWPLPPYECQILNLAVLPEHRRKGAAKALLTAVEMICAQAGIEDVTLEVRVSNAGAIALYESCGYATEGVRKNYYENSEDALIMWKRGILG